MDNNQLLYKTTCLQLIEEKLGWGSSVGWSNQDFEKLSTLIQEQTSVLLSVSTLKRVWGKVKYNNSPTHSTMDALAGFLGYENWRSFAITQAELQRKKEIPLGRPQASPFRYKSHIIRYTTIVLLIFAAGAFIYKKNREESLSSIVRPIKAADFTFSSKPVTRSIPNSVVFTYDASMAPTDSIFIQQNWDPKRREVVTKQGTTHTSIYYEPGHYNAKLVVGHQTIKEHALLIPTDNWLGLIRRSPYPTYIQNEDFIHSKQLDISAEKLKKYKVDPFTEPTDLRYYNVGNFKPVPINNFEFSAQVKSNVLKGADPCRHSNIGLFTENMPISFPLSIRGCISDLTLSSVDGFFSGKEHDLSKFGADLSKWVDIKCKGTAKSIQYYVNGELAYEAPLITDTLHIVGMVYGFSGGGSVRHIRLRNDNETVFEAF